MFHSKRFECDPQDILRITAKYQASAVAKTGQLALIYPQSWDPPETAVRRRRDNIPGISPAGTTKPPMPELPDVQVFKEYLDATSLHQQIESVHVGRPDILGRVSPRALQRRLKSRSIESSRRHGKWLFAEISDDGWLVLHFGMTGYLSYSRTEDPPKHTRLLLHFDNGSHLAYVCMRMLGTVDWTDDPQDFIEEKGLGIDALSEELNFSRFRGLIRSKKGSIKAALMDQDTIAGLGNIYTDEILFQAQVHPKSDVGELDEDSLKAIHRRRHRVLQAAIEARVDTSRMPKKFLLRHRGEADATCPRCRSPLKTAKIAGRTTYFCPGCQRP